MTESTRAVLDTVLRRHGTDKWPCPLVPRIHVGPAISVESALSILGMGFYGAIDKPEGVVYRCERNGKVEFVAKFVRPDFVPGRYLESDR